MPAAHNTLSIEKAIELYRAKLLTIRVPALALLAEAEDYMMLMGELARRLGVKTSTVSESVRSWEREGLVALVTPKKDRRSTTVILTPGGVRAILSVEGLYETFA